MFYTAFWQLNQVYVHVGNQQQLLYTLIERKEKSPKKNQQDPFRRKEKEVFQRIQHYHFSAFLPLTYTYEKKNSWLTTHWTNNSSFNAFLWILFSLNNPSLFAYLSSSLIVNEYAFLLLKTHEKIAFDYLKMERVSPAVKNIE